jgi:hypothetical protein
VATPMFLWGGKVEASVQKECSLVQTLPDFVSFIECHLISESKESMGLEAALEEDVC